jgi:hypothetical protein
MKPKQVKPPLSVLAQALGVAIIVGTPVIFVAFNQIRRACGDRMFGSREHFCSAHELWLWWWSLPGWSPAVALIVIVATIAMTRWWIRKIAS